MTTELIDAVSSADDVLDIGCLVITGSSKSFAAERRMFHSLFRGRISAVRAVLCLGSGQALSGAVYGGILIARVGDRRLAPEDRQQLARGQETNIDRGAHVT